MCRFKFFGKLLQKVTSGKVAMSDAPEAVSAPSTKGERSSLCPECQSRPWGQDSTVYLTSQDAVDSLPPETGCKCLCAIEPSSQGAEPSASSGADVCQLCLSC